MNDHGNDEESIVVQMAWIRHMIRIAPLPHHD